MNANPVAYKDFKTYEYPNGNTIRAIIVDSESEWYVVGLRTAVAHPGDVVIALTPFIYEVHSGQSILDGASEVPSPVVVEEAPEPTTVESVANPAFDPTAHTAKEVAQYLSEMKLLGRNDEYERVYIAEQRGLNRVSALR